ncbi:molybdopterin synthase sulfur carrier subunit [Thalassotalea insulae]|uniref:Molybdopterin synthase sulfur carrier subunit n=1 Tax=Thalassotalea insulae TaxID=2056778 RepID=A0ABQ6GNV9_9GAMM|nr:molybdopterin converting factor subunit 1 [Thalassotalea insulae]GLX77685.1 molybdopterin synthase sulfur carrier subunit [Thalassotalea insulae]
MIKVVFFAALREKLGCSELTVEATNINTVEQVKQQLIETHPQWSEHLMHSSLLSAVNNDMVSAQHQVAAGDEVAFFPPVTGG